MFKSLREDIQCIRERDPAARGGFEILTTYPGIHALGLHRISHALWRRNFKWLAKVISAFSRWFTGIEIHPNVTIGKRFFIDHGMGVVIGETSEIGDDCTLYQGSTLGGTSWNKGKRHPTLQNGVVVGAGAKILGPITVGQGARVGSNAVVVKDVPPGATVIGIPGHIIRHGSEEQKAQAIAQKLGFDSYGLSKEMPDPVTHAINRMLAHIQAMDEKVEAIGNVVTSLGGELKEIDLPELDHCEVEPDYPDHDSPREDGK
uniref:Serine acetyltransferase n=1 Tax=Candidatus Kentrum sp. MB TaxID=2138164 RepID=A0A450X9Y6_9GAMM|nr:MAG: serine O-acetyltransferase [Candidatus Kentron sp. MB]VFK31329.1 MAG: serine O-acetyltransferase [Candidatus Kentron sp. MB]VFK75440.1 MAG: serine O-acetyltransferase [Candidatus Kentron sp. MB]